MAKMSLNSFKMIYISQTQFLYLQLCTSSDVSDKSKYKTFARTILDPGHLAHEVLEIFRHFHWNRTSVIWEDIPVWAKRKDTLVEALKKNFVTIASTTAFVSVKIYTRKHHEEEFKSKLEARKAETRSKCMFYHGALRHVE